MRWVPVALVGVAQLPLVVITVMQRPAPWLLPVQVQQPQQEAQWEAHAEDEEHRHSQARCEPPMVLLEALVPHV